MASSKRVYRVLSAILSALFIAALVLGGAPVPAAHAAGALCVNPGGTDGCYATITAAIAAAAPVDTINIRAGTYQENVVVDKPLTLTGAGQDLTVLMPAVNGPTCDVGTSGSLCSGSSTILLVQADDVHILNMTLDGDNPNLTGVENRGGADLNARNGIITDNTTNVVYHNLEVGGVLVKNMYLSAIYNSGYATGFYIHDNTVVNVQGDDQSIAIFNFGGSGVFSKNTVDAANDGIVAKWSTGTQFLDNIITHSGRGVHTDYVQGSGDMLIGNRVSECKADGYGLFVFNPNVPVVVDANKVSGCAVALAQLGAQTSQPTFFSRNEVDGAGVAGSKGAYITTSLIDYGSANVAAALVNNLFSNFNDAVYVEAEDTFTATAVLLDNSINASVNGVTKVEKGTGTGTVIAPHNWWGAASGPTTAANLGGIGATIPDGVAFSPWICDGVDASTEAGFQPSTAQQCGVATHLVFITEPGNGTVTTPLNAQPVLRALDDNGNLGINFTGSVALALGSNPSAAPLKGQTAVNVVNGEAVFTDVLVPAAGTGYTLIASTADLPDSVTSAAFDVTQGKFFLPVLGN